MSFTTTTPLSITPTRTSNPQQTATQSSSDGSNTPSVYLICFVVIICVLLSISLFVAIRAVLIRRRIHAAWAASGFAEDFFDNHPSFPTSITGLGRMGTLSGRAEWNLASPQQGRSRRSGKSKKLGKKPEIWEIAMDDKDSLTWDEPVFGVDEGKGKSKRHEWDGLRGRVAWTNINPISLIHVPPSVNITNDDITQSFMTNPPYASGSIPKVSQDLRLNSLSPSRPGASVPYPAPLPNVSGSDPSVQTLEYLLPGQSQVDISVIIALPVDPVEAERKRGKRQADLLYNGGEDEGEDLPEVWLGTERVLIR
ncbi:hypothetical protein [Phaffia rhodozyma]|uniref:Uncharacterized protein n=1 Tax=Phaffia rhodozyma TaxID=264483 RepID=A0A0F7SUM0_PHARH|nr:hypothetical protein [Phaffia rhodozyma]